MRNTLILFFLLLSGIAHTQVAIDTATDFTVKDIYGNQHHLYGYLDAGSYVVLDFYTTNCGPCQTYASEVSASYDYFGCNGGNVVYMGINWGSDNNAVHIFDSIWGANYPSVSGLQGGGNNVVDAYQVQSYPSVILIAPDRSILNNHIWPPLRDTINSEVLTAGGIPQACTVGLESAFTPPAMLLQALPSGQGSVQLKYNQAIQPGMQLQLFASDGRMLLTRNLTGNNPELLLSDLKPGVYIARMILSGLLVATIKFSSY
ncbi:MAG: peroxiredoxin family protein [Lentimicrobium sp.]